MAWLLEHEPAVHYAQVRPMRTAPLFEQDIHDRFSHGHGIAMDCSEGVTLLCRLAGLHDPNGLHYSGYGNSSSLFGHLPRYSDPKRAGVGALVVFGPAGADHAAMVMGPGTDPWLWSHGAEGGPRRVRYSVEKAVHRAPATFLSIAHL